MTMTWQPPNTLLAIGIFLLFCCLLCLNHYLKTYDLMKLLSPSSKVTETLPQIMLNITTQLSTFTWASSSSASLNFCNCSSVPVRVSDNSCASCFVWGYNKKCFISELILIKKNITAKHNVTRGSFILTLHFKFKFSLFTLIQKKYINTIIIGTKKEGN